MFIEAKYGYDEQKLVSDYFESALLRDFPEVLDPEHEKYCNLDTILANKDYEIKSRDYIQIHCPGGTAVVYVFNQGFGRYALLTSWRSKRLD